MSRRMQRPVVDFPQPDSPTSPSVSPFLMSKVTSSTACTRATSREKRPPRIGKYFLRFLILSSACSAMVSVLSVEPAGHLVAGLDFLERRVLLGARGLHEGAARGEAAAGRDVALEGGDGAADGLQALALGGGQVDARDGAEVPLGVGVQR